MNNDIQVSIYPQEFDVNTFDLSQKMEISFKINRGVQQDGHGPFPTLEDKIEEILKEVKIEILKQIDFYSRF